MGSVTSEVEDFVAEIFDDDFSGFAGLPADEVKMRRGDEETRR